MYVMEAPFPTLIYTVMTLCYIESVSRQHIKKNMETALNRGQRLALPKGENMKSIYFSKITNVEVFVCGEEDAMTFERKIGYVLKNEKGRFSKLQYIELTPILSGKPLNKFYKYGFTKAEVDDLTEILAKELPNIKYKNLGTELSFNEVCEMLTAYAEQEKDLKTEDGFLGIEVHKFRKWFETEENGWKYLEFLETAEFLKMLKHNKGRNDYRLKSNGDRYYCFKPSTDSRQEMEDVA